MRNKNSPLQTPEQGSAEAQRAKYFEDGLGSTEDKLRSVLRFLGRQELAKIMAYERVFTSTRGVGGSIADCGVYFGGGLMTYASLLATLEPYNYQCRVLGFDTFTGDSSQSDLDFDFGVVDRNEWTYTANGSAADLQKAIALFDLDRPLAHIPRVELVPGDLCDSAPSYMQKHPELILRIIHLSVNLYKPTLQAIKSFYPRLSPGGILVVHGLNFTPGATQALWDAFESMGIVMPAIEVCEFYPNLTWLMKPVP